MSGTGPGSQWVTVTVPPVPEGLRPGACWRRTVTALDHGKRGGFAVLGEPLAAGADVRLPAGTLLIAVDRADTRPAPRRGKPWAMARDATVTVLLVHGDGDGDGAREVWSRHYKSDQFACGATTLRTLTKLLAEHPPPPPGPRAPVRRPNSEAGACRWCTVVVSAGAGHQPDRDGDRVEHWLACPPRAAVNGAVCALCGRSVVGLDAHQVLAERTEDAVWETRHRPSLDCTGTPRRTWEEFQADQADKERAAERGREEARRYQERLTQARAAEEAAARAEDTVVAAHLGDRATAAPPARVLAKQLRDGRRLALYLVPTPADPGRCEILRLIDGRIDGTSRPSTRRNTDPRTMTELPCLLNIAAGTSIGLTAAEERALDKALDAWADRPLRALREAAPQASTWKMAESPEFTGIGAIVRDPLRPGRPLVVVLDVRRRWENEDGLAHGLMRDEGWLYTPTVRALTPDEYARAQREGRLPEN